ncbi:MAG: MarC family protein [Oceanococcus sp.]
MLEFALDTFITFFVVIDPVGMAPIFVGLTTGASAEYRRKMAIRGALIGAGILIGFAAVGQLLLDAMGISLPAMRIAGGILLFLVAIDMLFARQSGLRSTTESETEEAHFRPDISVFPLAIPLMAGPGGITTVLLLVSAAQGDWAQIGLGMGIMLLVLAMALLALLFASSLTRLLGEIGSNVISRVLGVILSALAVQFVITGIAALGFGNGGV